MSLLVNYIAFLIHLLIYAYIFLFLPQFDRHSSMRYVVLHAKGFADQADAIFKRAMTLRDQAVGRDHPAYAEVLHNRGE